MRFYLYVNKSKHQFVEVERLPEVGETLLFRDTTGSIEESKVTRVVTEVLGGKTDLASPTHVIYHVYAETEK